MTTGTLRRPPLWLLVAITISGTMAMHMFVPALPDARADFAASVGPMQMTISIYIIGLGVGQLFYGPMSDSLGRRPLLLAGLGLYALGSVVSAFAPNVHILIAARLVQALGGCAGLALGRAIVRDSNGPTDTVRQLALLNLMMMISPGLSPVVGGAISSAFGWRAVFWLLAGMGLATLALAWKLLPETAPTTGRALSFRAVAGDYRTLLRSRPFIGFAIGGGCATTSVYAFIATAPFIFAGELHRPLHEVGIYLGLLISGMTLGNLLTARLASRIRIDRLLLGGNMLSIVGATGLLATILLGDLGVANTLAWMFVFTCGAGITSPAALTKAVSVNPRLTGSAAGLYGFTQMAIGAICTSLVAFGQRPALSAVAVLLGAAVIAQITFRMAGRAAPELRPA